MSVAYKCTALANPVGPGIVVTVEVKVGAQGPMVFEVPVTKAEVVNTNDVNPRPFALRIARALLLGATPASLIGTTETE